MKNDEQQLQREFEKAQLAKRLMEDEAFISAIDSTREAIIDSWINSPVRDLEGQKFLKLQLLALDSIIKNIESVIMTGKMAHMSLEQQKSKKLESIKPVY